MKNSLMIFEGIELEVLTKEDVSFEFEGTVLLNGKQVGNILEYSRGSKAIADNVRDNQKYKIKNSDVLKQDFRKLNNAGETFVNEKGVMKLIINSDMPKADEFEDKVWDIVTKVQQTGKYDSIEEKLKLIEDDKERELSLGLYSLQQALKVNPSDMLLIINCKQKENELTTYKQQKHLELVSNKLIEQEKKLDNMFVIGDRVQFTNEINRIARSTGKQQSEIYNLTYGKLKGMYGIDLNSRAKHRQSEIQNKRIEQGKKAYASATLKNKANNLVIADELNIWCELGNSLNAVKNELMN
ncbi:Bro-N domain-containing protein (plasmid) [Clostridium botulinum]|uniref:BRO family protein n=1 Tax=Clostridium botulinum TaxID=1491 RepID=UPI00068AA354|nr:Bro-N domain-containing protein [Clostridium botulinum]MCD3232594.1 Bro-N domain-containing protein [Clostridium botulinum D/C]MCD3238477.1 Bro-N domain-containing protein [Clostridium botulinum D/C]MCD3266003.1 Bro-N domain-containing protein [Clostridium botulinum D/C]MCD3300917.1 Bro-N domain-containing protein [Clostridium botulinum D/C]MCD3304242.1 Bro-N domain-containing protein [Clostridium botulinum D/C]